MTWIRVNLRVRPHLHQTNCPNCQMQVQFQGPPESPPLKYGTMLLLFLRLRLTVQL